MLRRLIRLMELMAGLLLSVLAALTCGTVTARYFFNSSIPDAFDFGRLMLSVAVLWGIGAAVYFGGHIQVDLLYASRGSRTRAIMDVFATAVVVGFLILLAYTCFNRAYDVLLSEESTSDLRILVGPFYLVGWLGLLVGVLLGAARLVTLLRGRDIEETAATERADG